MTRVGANECGQGMSFKMCAGDLNKPQIKGETKLDHYPITGSGADAAWGAALATE